MKLLHVIHQKLACGRGQWEVTHSLVAPLQNFHEQNHHRNAGRFFRHFSSTVYRSCVHLRAKEKTPPLYPTLSSTEKNSFFCALRDFAAPRKRTRGSRRRLLTKIHPRLSISHAPNGYTGDDLQPTDGRGQQTVRNAQTKKNTGFERVIFRREGVTHKNMVFLHYSQTQDKHNTDKTKR